MNTQLDLFAEPKLAQGPIHILCNFMGLACGVGILEVCEQYEGKHFTCGTGNRRTNELPYTITELKGRISDEEYEAEVEDYYTRPNCPACIEAVRENPGWLGKSGDFTLADLEECK